MIGSESETLKIVIKARDEASKVLTGMTGKMKKTAKDMKGIGVGMTAMGVGIGAMSYNFIKVASDAEETQSKFNVVFRGMEKEMNDWAESFGKDTGRAKQDIKAWSSGMADVLKPMGLTTKESGKMSKKMVQLALDVASFNNRQDADVIHAFNSALTGERESLKTLGIVINEADVKQEAYASGLAEVGEELSKEAKAQATVNLLFKNTEDAQGDLMRTQDSYANKTKKVRSQIKDLSETLGNELLPIVTPMVEKISEAVTRFAEWAAENKELTKKIVIGIAAFGALMLVLGPILIILPGIVTAVGLVGGALGLILSPIGLAVLAIGAIILVGYNLIKNWEEYKETFIWLWEEIKIGISEKVKELKKSLEIIFGAIKNVITTKLNELKTSFQTIWDFIKDTIVTPIVDGIKSKIEEITETIDRIIEKFNEMIRKAKEAMEKASGAVGGLGGWIGGGIQSGMSSIGLPTMNDFISRPGSAPVSFSPDDTIIGVKKPLMIGGGGGIVININGGNYLSEDAAEEMGDKIIDKLKTQLRL